MSDENDGKEAAAKFKAHRPELYRVVVKLIARGEYSDRRIAKFMNAGEGLIRSIREESEQ
jgi:hypothetical protein